MTNLFSVICRVLCLFFFLVAPGPVNAQILSPDPLYDGAERGNYADVRKALLTGSSPNVRGGTQITALIGALTSGWLTRRYNCVAVVLATLILWTMAGIMGMLAQNSTQFWILALTAGLAMGSSLPAARAIVARFSPPGQSAEFFGFWGLCARAAAILSNLGFLVIYQATNNLRATIGYFTATFVVGIFLLLRVDEARGLEESQR